MMVSQLNTFSGAALLSRTSRSPLLALLCPEPLHPSTKEEQKEKN
jgi:hypothetical protein